MNFSGKHKFTDIKFGQIYQLDRWDPLPGSLPGILEYVVVV